MTVLSSAGIIAVVYILWRYWRFRNLIRLQWPSGLSEADFKTYCGKYIKHKGWNTVRTGLPLDWQASNGKTRFTIYCYAGTAPIIKTIIMDINDIKRRYNSVVVLKGQLSSTDWHLLDHYGVKSIHYTELAEFCERMLTENVYPPVEIPHLSDDPEAPAAVAGPAEIAAPADSLPGDLAYLTVPSSPAHGAGTADINDAPETPDGDALPHRDAAAVGPAGGQPQLTSWRLAINDALVSAAPLACRVEENVYATPFKMFTQGGEDFDQARGRYKHTRFHTTGAAYGQDGALIEESRRPGGLGGDYVESIDPDHIAVPLIREGMTFPGTTLYLGNYMNYYGHLVTEFLSKLWCIDDVKFDQIVIRPFIFNAGKVVLFDFAKELLNVALPGDSQIRVVTGDAFFERAVIPAQAWPINAACNVAVRPLYTKISAHFRSGEPKGRIFLTENQKTYTGIANLAEVERVAAELGFTVVNPETLSMTDQMLLYANAHVIAGFVGATMHNCLFSRPGTAVISLGDTRTRAKPRHMQAVAHAISNVDMYHVPYRGTDDGICDTAPLRADLADILRAQGYEVGDE
jgi:hypothetical protein